MTALDRYTREAVIQGDAILKNCVANGIREIIEEKGMVQREVAKRAGFTAQQLNDMLFGRKIIRAEYIPAIAKALNVEIEELFTDGGGQ